MLWYKAWLETRMRLVLLMASVALIPFTHWALETPLERLAQSSQTVPAFLYCFAALFLAGSGVNTQTTYAARQGIHGSMQFTLSLPVSRRRLFCVRAGLGAMETAVFVALLGGLALAVSPEALSTAQTLQYLGRAIVCVMSAYALSAMLACVLDDVWQFQGGFLILGAIWLLQSRSDLVAQFSPLSGMSLETYPATGPVPWAPIVTSVAVTAVLIFASVRVLQRKEY